MAKIDLKIDSDNTNGFGAPDGNATEDQMEDDQTLPGKYVASNLGDKDGDSIPDFADGFNLLPRVVNDDANVNEKFVPLKIEVSGTAVDMTKARFRFNDSASDPTTVPRPDRQGNYQSAARRRQAASGRSTGPAASTGRRSGPTRRPAATGHYVAPGNTQIYTAAQSGFAGRVATLYVEGIKPSAAGDARVVIELDPDGPGPADFMVHDAVRITVVDVDLDVNTDRNGVVNDRDERGEDNWVKDRGAIMMTNYDDDNASGSPNSIGFDDKGIPDFESNFINGAGDVPDITPFVVGRPGVKDGLQFFLRMDASDLKAVHVFEERAANKARIGAAGPTTRPTWASRRRTSPPRSRPAPASTSAWRPSSSAARRCTTRSWPRGRSPTAWWTSSWSCRRPRAAAIVPAKVIATDKVRLKVVPYMMLPNTQNAQTVWMSNLGSGTSRPPSAGWRPRSRRNRRPGGRVAVVPGPRADRLHPHAGPVRSPRSALPPAAVPPCALWLPPMNRPPAAVSPSPSMSRLLRRRAAHILPTPRRHSGRQNCARPHRPAPPAPRPPTGSACRAASLSPARR